MKSDARAWFHFCLVKFRSYYNYKQKFVLRVKKKFRRNSTLQVNEKFSFCPKTSSHAPKNIILTCIHTCIQRKLLRVLVDASRIFLKCINRYIYIIRIKGY